MNPIAKKSHWIYAWYAIFGLMRLVKNLSFKIFSHMSIIDINQHTHHTLKHLDKAPCAELWQFRQHANEFGIVENEKRPSEVPCLSGYTKSIPLHTLPPTPAQFDDSFCCLAAPQWLIKGFGMKTGISIKRQERSHCVCVDGPHGPAYPRWFISYMSCPFKVQFMKGTHAERVKRDVVK